ncbi:MAG TPA: sugar phosphate isomerase/epimerase [Vicinamibacterales bacterium]|nr:sugar phosphate isomerase/epimerase [Vicinamibacterales bacterium]
MNPIGITSWIWTSPLTTERFPEIAQHVARLGFDLLEVPIESTGDLDYKKAAGVIKELGLQTSVCAAMSPDRDLIHSDESVRKNAMSYVRHCVDAAQTLGAANVVGPLYSAVGRTWQATADERQRDVELLVKELKELSAYAHERGVVLCVEPLNRFETSFLNLASQAIAIVDEVGHPGCGLLLDTFHMNIEEQSIGAAIRSAGARLKHLHACENDRGAPGTGHIQWTEVADACRAINYQGPAVIESFTAAVKSIARAAAIWRPLARTQDGLAQDGLKTLRRVFG